MKRNLQIEIDCRLHNCDGELEGDVEVTIYEPETGDVVWDRIPYSPDEHPEFNEWIGNEIYSWISLMADEI